MNISTLVGPRSGFSSSFLILYASYAYSCSRPMIRVHLLTRSLWTYFDTVADVNSALDTDKHGFSKSLMQHVDSIENYPAFE